MSVGYQIGHMLGTKIKTEAEMGDAIHNEELPASALIEIVRLIAGSDTPRTWTPIAQRIVSRATWNRAIKEPKSRLSQPVADRTERVASLLDQAIEVWGDADLARQFVLTHQTALRGAPLDLTAEATVGARRSAALLNQIDHGLAV